MCLKKIFISFIIFPVMLLSITACVSQGEPVQPSSGNTTNQRIDGVPFPPPDYPKKGNPKLDSALWQLIDAEKTGELESFTKQMGSARDDVIGGNVRVNIDAVIGKLDAATKAAATVGVVEIVSDSQQYPALQAVVPITSLGTLADEPGIRLIDLPTRGVPQ